MNAHNAINDVVHAQIKPVLDGKYELITQAQRRHSLVVPDTENDLR